MVIFLIVTFGLPLLCVILSNHIGSPIINLILLAIQGATPSIGSLIVFRKTINAFIKDKVLHNISIKWWLVSMLFPVLMLVLSKGIIVVVGKSNHVLQAISPMLPFVFHAS